MADKSPLKATYTGADPTGLAEFISTDTIGFVDGGTGLASLGTAGQILKVNTSASALEYGNVEAVFDIDGMTDGSGITIAATDKFGISDGGTEKYIVASQIDTYISGTTSTLTNKTITSPVLNTGITGTAIKDEDTMVSDSATHLATQQSIKAYVDTHSGDSSNPHSVTKTQVGLGNADNTTDANKPVSTAQQTALDAKLDDTQLDTTTTLGTDDTKIPSQKAVKTYVDTQVATENELTEMNDVTIVSVVDDDIIAYDSTSSKYINQSAAEAGLATASDLVSHSGDSQNPHSVTKAQVGLSNVDNTTDANKPVSTATQTALDAKLDDTQLDTTTTLGTDDTKIPSQKAVKTYVDTQLTAENLDVAGDSGTIAIDLDSETFTVAGGTGLTSAAATNAVTIGLDNTAVSAASYGSATAIPAFTVDAQGRLTSASTNALSLSSFDSDDLSEGSTNLYFTNERVDDRVNTLVTDGEGINTTYNDPAGTLTIAGEDASTSNKGIASFATADFSVTAGAVAIKAGGVSDGQLAGSISNANLANSTITVTDGTNSTAAALGDTVTFSGTANEVTVAESSGTITIGLPDDVTIAGNLTVSGDTTTVNTATLSVEDPLIVMASGNNAADTVDIGFYGLYDTSGSQNLYAGLFRDANDSGKWKLFKDNQAVPGTTVDTSGTGYAVATLVADLEGAVTGNADTATILTTGRTVGMTGDVAWTSASFDGSGNVTGTATIQANAVDSAEITSGAIDNAHMSADSIDSDQYVDGSIDLIHLAADSVDGTKIADDSIDSEHYAAGSIDNEHLANDAVGADELASNAVVDASIASGAAIDATKIADGSVTSTEFQYINTLSSNAQTQITNVETLANAAATKGFSVAMSVALG